MALADIQRIVFDIEMTNPTGQVAELIKLLNELPEAVNEMLSGYIPEEDFDEVKEDLEEADETINELKSEIDELKNTINDLENKEKQHV